MSKLLIAAAASTNKRAREREETEQSIGSSQKSKVTSKKAKSIQEELVPKKYSKQKDNGSKKSHKAKIADDSTPNESSVIYLGHIAHGFYEKEMKKFFAQFGEVKRVKLFRSPKTGNSKGYAFIEFETPDVASIVADSMNGYFLHERQLVCHVVPPSKFHDGMFLYPRKKEAVVQTEFDIISLDAPEVQKTQEQMKSFVKQQKKKMEKLKSMGIYFDCFASLKMVTK
jgi:nucleolar protein 15